jgi:uncharacterized membrane protein
MTLRGTARMVFFDFATILIGAAFTAGLVHIVAILIIPLYASNDAYARLAKLGPTNVTILLSQDPASGLFPFRDPAVAASFCRYDLRQGPLRVKAPITRYEFSSLSFHTRRGGIFYALTDRAATQGALEALVVTDKQLQAISARDAEDEPVRELRVVSATSEGFVMMRSFSQEPSAVGDAEARVGALKCQSEAEPH